MSLVAAGVVALSASPALALNAIELQDERNVNRNGLQLIYEVRACLFILLLHHFFLTPFVLPFCSFLLLSFET